MDNITAIMLDILDGFEKEIVKLKDKMDATGKTTQEP